MSDWVRGECQSKWIWERGSNWIKGKSNWVNEEKRENGKEKSKEEEISIMEDKRGRDERIRGIRENKRI